MLGRDQRIRGRAAIVMACATITLTLLSCDWLRWNANAELRREFIDSLVSEIRGLDGGGTLDLGTVTTFDWHRLHIIQPYTPDNQTDRMVGADVYSGEVRTDNVTLFVFSKDGKVVLEADVPRICSFHPPEPHPRWAAFEVAREASRFEIETDINAPGSCDATALRVSTVYDPRGNPMGGGRGNGSGE